MLASMDEEMFNFPELGCRLKVTSLAPPSSASLRFKFQVVVVNGTDEWGDFHKVGPCSNDRNDFTILHLIRLILVYDKLNAGAISGNMGKLNLHFSYCPNPVDSACAGMKRP